MKSYDVAVVGGGIIGKALALRLSGCRLATLLVDPIHKPDGVASSAAGAMLGAFGEVTAGRSTVMDEAELRFRILASQLYHSWIGELEETTGTRIPIGRGTIVIANTLGARDGQNIDAMAAKLAAYGQPFEWLDPTRAPGLKPSPHHMAYKVLYMPNEGFIDISELSKTIEVTLNGGSNLEFLDDSVTGLVGTEDRVLGIKTKGHGKIQVGHVVLCAGIGTQGILDQSPPLSSRFPRMVAGKGVGLILRAQEHFPYAVRTPNRGFACGTHIVPRQQGLVYVGATNRIWTQPAAAAGVMMGELHYLLDTAMHEINTNLSLARVEVMLFGSRPVSVDRFPIVGKTAIEGLSIATGTYRNGVLMAPLIAEIVSDELMGTGAKWDNPFSPKARPLTSESVTGNRVRVINEAARDFVGFLQDPGGRLPYNRARELEDIVRVLALIALAGDTAYSNVREEAQALLDTYPLAEIFPELLYRLHRAAGDS